MKVGELIEQLQRVDLDLDVEIATQPHRIEDWYDVIDIELALNTDDEVICIINTD